MFSQAIKFFEINGAKIKLFFWQLKNKSNLAPLILIDTNCRGMVNSRALM